jgi:hypothetical protein
LSRFSTIGPEQLGIAAAERAAGDEIDHFAQRRVLLVMIARAIPTHLHLSDFGGGEAEEEEILVVSRLLAWCSLATAWADCSAYSRIFSINVMKLLCKADCPITQRATTRYEEIDELSTRIRLKLGDPCSFMIRPRALLGVLAGCWLSGSARLLRSPGGSDARCGPKGRCARSPSRSCVSSNTAPLRHWNSVSRRARDRR